MESDQPSERASAAADAVTVPAAREEPQLPTLQPLVPSPPPAAVLERSRGSARWRMRFALIIAGVCLLCVGGGVYLLVDYDRSTTADTSSPSTVLNAYLTETLGGDSGVSTQTLVCAHPSGLEALLAFRDAYYAAGTTRRFMWSIPSIAPSGSTMSVEVPIAVAGGPPHVWIFDLEGPDRWRVCGASQIS